MDDIGYQSPIIEGRRRKSHTKKFIIIGIVLLIIIPLGIGGMKVLGGSFKPNVTPTPMPTEIAFPTDTPMPTVTASPSAVPTPTKSAKKTTVDSKTGINKTTIRVVIENGSGIAGAANKAATLLKDAGYTVLETKNADNFDYQDVTILVKPTTTTYLPLLKQDILTEYTLAATNTNLDASASADAVVIIGK